MHNSEVHMPDAVTIATAAAAAVGSPIVSIAVVKARVDALKEQFKDFKSDMLRDIDELKASKAEQTVVAALEARIDKLDEHLSTKLDAILVEVRK